jgi:uncharacterized protein (DUF58 family)
MPTDTTNELFDAEFLDNLRALFLKLRKRHQLKRKAVQPTHAAGFTREFKDHRQYVAGDDYRAIDWRLYARLKKVFIRIYEVIQEFHVHILIDRSQSMLEPHGEKRIAALRLGVALAYLALYSQHRVSVLSFAGDMRRETPPMKGQGQIHEILRRAAALEFGGVTDLGHVLGTFRPSRERRGLVFLISDLFGREPEAAEAALRHAWSWPAETHVIHVVNPREAEPSMEGEIQLVDVETDETRRIWLTRRDIQSYREAFQSYLSGLETACLRHQVNYLLWPTDQSFEDMFLHLLSRGSALAGT